MGYSGAGGKLIYEKNQKQKISRHCPFKLAPFIPAKSQEHLVAILTLWFKSCTKPRGFWIMAI